MNAPVESIPEIGDSIAILHDLESVSTLERLPTDVIMKLIEYVPEAVYPLRLASQTLRYRVDECALFTGTIPLCSELSIIGKEKKSVARENRTVLDISMFVPNKRSSLFELRLFFRSQRNLRNKMSKIKKQTNVYSFRFNSLIDSESMLECLGQCTGRVEQVMLFSCNDSATLSIIAKLLETIPFERLEVTVDNFTANTASHILGIVKARKVDDFSLNVRKISAFNPGGILLQLSSLVRSLRISQEAVHNIAHTTNYFFGITNVDWAPIILEMFSSKLTRLRIVNNEYPRYLPRDSASTLIKEIPKLGKEINFSASCISYENWKYYMRNDYDIYANYFNLWIEHSSSKPKRLE